MAWNCDVCGESIHFRKLDNGKVVATQCPLESYKTVRSYLTEELRFLAGTFHDVPVTSEPEDLKILKNIVPDKTALSDYISKKDRAYQVKSMVVSGTLRTFYLHFLRFLTDFYGDNTTHFIKANEIPTVKQFNYLLLTETMLRECYFNNTHAKSRFKTMSDFLNPSLLIYSLGAINGIFMKNKGDILMEVVTARRSQGKPTWIIHSKPFAECEEIKTSENLRLYLANSSYMPRIQLDESEDDPEVYATSISGMTGSSGRRNSGRASKGSAEDDPYNLM